MSHSFELDISTVVQASTVEQLVKDIVQTRTGKAVSTITVRYDGTKFDGYDIQFQSEVASEKKKENLFDKSWKPFVWDK